MASITEQNKRLAKNTLLLYIRQLFVIIITLYTSRIVLQTLGINDFGIYNVVGGIVGMLGFLNSAMTSASQRFISFELGQGNIVKLKSVFSSTVVIHVCLAFVILLLAETFGLWFLNSQLNIEQERMVAANWVFQCAALTSFITIVNVPYNAVLVAHEQMNVFAYFSIANTLFKLLIVYLLLVSPWDKLITYSILGLVVQVFFQFLYMLYCKYKCNYSAALIL